MYVRLSVRPFVRLSVCPSACMLQVPAGMKSHEKRLMSHEK